MSRQEFPFTPAPGVPTAAGVWNYWAGGENYTMADQEAGDHLAELYPHLVTVALHSRAFQQRAVKYMVAAGIRQIIDIGTGLPMPVNTHDMAGDGTTVVYVDNDPAILAHARAELVGERTAYVEADLTEPEHVLGQVAETIDLSKPTGVLILSTLGLVNPPDDATNIVQRYTTRLASGSMLAIADTLTSAEVREAEERYAATDTTPYIARSEEEIRATAEGMEILPPGIVPVTQWPAGNDFSQQYGYVARKP